MMTSRLAFATVVVALGAACGEGAEEGGAGGPPGGGQGQMPPPEVTVVPVGTERVTLTTELPGRTAPYLVAEVRPQVGGLVLERLFAEGADVKAGDVLYRIDPASYEVALAMARANLQRAEAGLSTSSTRSRRIATLVEKEIASKQDSDDASGSVLAYRADVAAARAAVEAAKLDLERTKVLAPISGRIGRSSVMQGALVAPYQTPLAVVQQLDPIYVDIVRSSVEVLRMKRALASGALARPGGEPGGAKVELVLEDGTRYPHAGRLEFADATVDQATSAITLRAVFPNPDLELLPGMYVRAVLEEGVAEGALLVPQQGVTRDPKGAAMAMVVTKEGMVEPRMLTVDRSVGDQWLVTAGITAGEQVIVEGLQKVRPGAPAKAVPQGAAAPAAHDAGNAPADKVP